MLQKLYFRLGALVKRCKGAWQRAHEEPQPKVIQCPYCGEVSQWVDWDIVGGVQLRLFEDDGNSHHLECLDLFTLSLFTPGEALGQGLNVG